MNIYKSLIHFSVPRFLIINDMFGNLKPSLPRAGDTAQGVKHSCIRGALVFESPESTEKPGRFGCYLQL